MPALTITDLTNAKQDVDHIAEVATSTSPTATDRLGNVKRTMAGASAFVESAMADVDAAKNDAINVGIPAAIATVAAINNRGAWATVTNYAIKDLVQSSGTWYICVSAHTSSLSFASDVATKWRVYQGVIAQDLAASSGAGMVGYMNAGVGALATTVLEWMRRTVSLADYDTLAHAIAALGPNGGVVEVPVGRFQAGNWDRTTNFMFTANVALVGKKMPYLSENADRLEGGSVIEGRFNVFAHGFTAMNVGFDLGKYVMDTYYPTYDSTLANHPNGGDWTAFSFGTNDSVTPAAPRRNVHVENVIGLLSRPLSNGHAVIMEAIDGLYVDNVVGVYGIHGVVFKAQNVRCGSVAGYMASTDNVIIKSDTYAISGNIQIDSITAQQYAPNVTPWIAPTKATYGLFINPATASFSGPVQIGKLKSISCGRAMLIRGTAGNTVTDLQIGQMFVDDAATLAVGADTCTAYRCTIGELIANNIGVGVAWQLPDVSYASENQLSIGACQLTSVTNWAIQAQGYARVKIDDLKIKTAGYAYYNEDNARILIGKEQFSGVVNKWYTTGLSAAPTRNFTYSDAAGYKGFEVSLENYQVVVRGVLRYDGGGNPTQNATLASFPPYLRPPVTQLFPSVRKSGTTYTSIGLGVTAGGSVTHNEGNSLPTVNDVVVFNISWKNW